MLKLYGFAVSNYYNMVKLALLEKGVPFEEVPFFAGKTPEALAISPRGKVPALGVAQGFINETSVILEYIEQTQTGPKLLPVDPFERAQVLALAKEIELYIELPARACYPEAFFGMQVPDVIKEKARTELLEGIASLGRHGKFAPYVAGDTLSVADIYFAFSVDLACGVAHKGKVRRAAEGACTACAATIRTTKPATLRYPSTISQSCVCRAARPA